MTLDNSIWKDLKAGYKTVYDASIPLKQLEKAVGSDEIKIILDELWNELHHQGDVGIASYLALPQIVRIAREKKIFDWNVLGLCAVIEQQRHLGKNPSLPVEFLSYYQQGLKDLYDYVISRLYDELDGYTYTTSLSALVTCKGNVKLGKAILVLASEGILDEFLSEY
jgi:hypothetical protein